MSRQRFIDTEMGITRSSLQCRSLIDGKDVAFRLLRLLAPSLHVNRTHNSKSDTYRGSSHERCDWCRFRELVSRLKFDRLDTESRLLRSVRVTLATYRGSRTVAVSSVGSRRRKLQHQLQFKGLSTKP